MIIGAKEREVSGVNFGNSGDGRRKKKKRIIDREANNNREDTTENTERETRSREEQEC